MEDSRGLHQRRGEHNKHLKDASLPIPPTSIWHCIGAMEDSGRPDRRRGEYRKYLRDASLPIPPTTLWRMKRETQEHE